MYSEKTMAIVYALFAGCFCNRTYANQPKFATQPPILGELEIKVPQNWGI